MEQRRSADGADGRPAAGDHRTGRAGSAPERDAAGACRPAALGATHALAVLPQRHPAAPAPQADDGVTWSASDIGRLLGALQICAARYPEHGAAINRLLADWPLAQMFRQRPYAPFALRDTPRWRLLSLNDRPGLGYRLYAQATLGGITPTPPLRCSSR
ncbi:DUF3131 domain-containing protein [Edwardsiella anguillarum]|nr:DUF3131 domain-containing protein [Edwardsiella anguillarum]